MTTSSASSPQSPVRELQRMLRLLAQHNSQLPGLAVTGRFDEPTLEAVMVFQRDASLPVTGVVDHTTWYAITDALRRDLLQSGPSSPLSVLPHGEAITPAGQDSEALRVAQILLASLSREVAGLTAQPDGPFDLQSARTDLSLIQALAGLPVTGDLDRATWEHLVRLYHAYVLRDGREGSALSS